ncbi:transglycosylase domain-containing protein [Croceicoccus sp. YJ47]|uniref:transglycosylase domain-containing protein n=1 Tax=Croceicoccus sp. YJ47 TaxID=2798724 RepID=UPI0019230265|nr:transglycosylase domain-containing protein [Croceicoccus sp. YJ47]QQN74869.1 transglycosylase domain-containing protein [Croceicoccus sp. YJ47]
MADDFEKPRRDRWWRRSRRDDARIADEPGYLEESQGYGFGHDWDEQGGGAADPYAEEYYPAPPDEPRRRGCIAGCLLLPFTLTARLVKWGAVAFVVLLGLTIVWLAATKPVSETLDPHGDPFVLVSQDGQPIARGGDVVLAPVEAEMLPAHVIQPFLAIEDRRFFSHWGVDPRGVARAFVHNLGGGSMQGGSTITMQLAKVTYYSHDRTMGRKLLEVPTALWLELWLTKEEILERYLSKIYFGDRSYGLRAASMRYFGKAPEDLAPQEAILLAGLPKAPSSLAPSVHAAAARARADVVKIAMVDAGYLTQAEARAMPDARLRLQSNREPPRYAHFTNWIRRLAVAEGYGADAPIIATTLDVEVQRAAEAAVRSVDVGDAEVALVAMRPDGAVLAMVGSKDYNANQFNHALAGRQPGSTFKLFVWLAALQQGMSPGMMVSDTEMPGGPRNAGNAYRGQITLEDAFVHSSNVVATRLYNQVGGDAVVSLAQDFGIDAAMDPADTSLPLGTADVSLLQLTAAYAGIARGEYPVRPYAVQPARGEPEDHGGRYRLDPRVHAEMIEMLRETVNRGTGQAARLPIPNFGKTGTSQENRNAVFVGWAGGIVAGVWVYADADSADRSRISGGDAPARIWRQFMIRAVPGAN